MSIEHTNATRQESQRPQEVPSIIPQVVQQHAEEAAILWMQRDHLAAQPHVNRIKNRIKVPGTFNSPFNSRCVKCKSATKEVDHVTRDANGNITKICQCKSDQSKGAGGDSEKGVICKPKQLVEDRKLRESLNKCQAAAGVECKIEYKLEEGAAAEEAKKFLWADITPTMVK